MLMKKYRLFLALLLLFLTFGLTRPVYAQTYLFKVSQHEVEAYINVDGSLTLYYYIVFDNNVKADPMEYIDIGLPSQNYDLKNIEATINDISIDHIAKSSYVDGIELGFGVNAIPSGQSGTVTVWIYNIADVLYPYDQPDRENYVNFQFSPNWFGSEYDKSTDTKYRTTIILPPEVGATEGVYYLPTKWPGSDTPEASLTTDGRVYYSWYTENANVHTQYTFGAAFPQQYIPIESINTKPDGSTGGSGSGASWPFLGLISGESLPCCCFGGAFAAFIGWVFYQATAGTKKRKLKYLPPKISIEGHGVKRGLTAVEAAVIMEEPMDKILTMILFGTLKKEAATVLEREPLKLEVTEPTPEGLHPYEKGFLLAFKEPTADLKRKSLQDVMVDLVKTTSGKMKGFSRKETVEYYKEIMQRAWKMVEDASTPELKSENYDRTLEWTMLDDDFNRRTERTFTGSPVFVPMWWPRYDPVYRQSTTSAPRLAGGLTTAGGSKPSVSLPRIPGSDFAASVINGSTAMAAGVVGSATDFTSGVTNRTNPIPVTSASSGKGGFRGGGGGSSCACACACAGCACACAGGGR